MTSMLIFTLCKITMLGKVGSPGNIVSSTIDVVIDTTPRINVSAKHDLAMIVKAERVK